MWAQWLNSAAPKISLQEILEHNGDRHLSGQTKALYTEKTDDQLDNPLIKPITSQPLSAGKTTYAPPLNVSTNSKPEKGESPFSPFYRFWGHT